MNLITSFHQQREWLENKLKEFPLPQTKLSEGVEKMKKDYSYSLMEQHYDELKTLSSTVERKINGEEDFVRIRNKEVNSKECDAIINKKLLSMLGDFVLMQETQKINIVITNKILQECSQTLHGYEKARPELDTDLWEDEKTKMVRIISCYI